MAIKKQKPTSPARRFQTWLANEDITRSEPEKSLVKGKRRTGGRNTHGRITSRHRGGGAKRRYRIIDFKRTKDGVPAKVASIEYDPNRTATSRCSTTPTARSATSSRRQGCVWAPRWSRGPMPTSSSA